MKVEKITPQIAALYLGQKCEYKSKEHPLQHGVITPLVIDLLQDRRIYITPHLRRIESLTEEEAREIYFIKTGRNWIDVYADTVSVDSCLDYYLNALDYDDIDAIQRLIGEPAVWLYLLGKGFDLFGLIDAGLAKDVGK